MNTLTTLTIASCMLAVSFVRADEKPPEAPKRHRGDGRVYEKKISASMVPPKGWEKGKDTLGSYLWFQGSIDDGRPNLNVRSFANPGVTIEKMAVGFKKGLADGVKSWETADEGFMQIDGRKAYYISGKFIAGAKGKEDSPQMQMISYFILGRRGHGITFTTLASKFDDLRKTFDESAKTFRGD